jgi:UDP-N-acetylglucosamine acyltransferase
VPRIHPTAVVDPAAKLADDVEIGAHAYVGAEVSLGASVVLRPHAYVTGRTTIGERSRVFPFAVLGEEPQDRSFAGETTRLVIGRDTTIREHAVIHVGTSKGGGCTQIGDETMILNGVHVGHDCRVGSQVLIASLCAIAGHVEIDDYAVVGGLTGIHQFVRVGESAMVAATSAVSQDVPPFALVAGDRARLSGLNVVGLRRRGFSPETRRQIHHAYHLVFHSKLRFASAAERVRAEIQGSPEVDRLLQFLSTSERGFVR